MGHVIVIDDGQGRVLGAHVQRMLAGTGHQILVAKGSDATRRIDACAARGIPVCVIADARALPDAPQVHAIALAGNDAEREPARSANQVVPRAAGMQHTALLVAEALRRWAPERLMVA